ncbi:MAG: hypothetical protein IJ697_06690 [Synergistaceae bacterium]|nr:hypothetical protein [Synergistaceae bacterium]
MATVTERIRQIEQPYGGYIRLSEFERIHFDYGVILNADENVDASLVASAVEYLTRLLFSNHEEKIGKRITTAFDVSLRGACIAQAYFGQKDAIDVCLKLLGAMGRSSSVRDIITNALKIVTFDVWYRNPFNAVPDGYKSVKPNKATIENIYTMLKRSKNFFEKYGPVTATGFDFKSSGYTKTVDKGDGDFLTADMLCDMKVYRPQTKITKKETLQVLMYWIMGQHSGQEVFKGITKIGLYNPRQNVAYILNVSKIPAEVIREVEEKVICY